MNVKPEFELSDKLGTTVLVSGSVGTSSTAIPAIADKQIDEISIRCKFGQPANRLLLFSFDNVTFHQLGVGDSREEEPRGTIKQIFVKAGGPGVTTVDYEAAINYGRLS